MAEKPNTTTPLPLAASGESRQGIDERRGVRRFPYAHVQQIAFFKKGRMPAQDAFRPVQCHEISQDGLSFFDSVLPEDEQLIVALGSLGLETLVLAKVRYHVPAQAVALFDPTTAVNERYLVECAFVRRVDA